MDLPDMITLKNQSYWADLDDHMSESAWVAGVICEMNLDKGHAFHKINESSQKAVIPKELVVKHNLNKNLNVLVVLENYVHTKSGTTKQRVVKVRIRE